MKKISINQESVPWEEERSPAGKFHKFRRHLTRFLGYAKDKGAHEDGMPYDIELTRVPAGSINFPYHEHANLWESYIILEGAGILRTENGERKIGKGEVVVCPPGMAHQIRNDGDTDLLYYVIADNSGCDLFYYPDSDKYGMKPDFKFFKISKADYFDGEE